MHIEEPKTFEEQFKRTFRKFHDQMAGSTHPSWKKRFDAIDKYAEKIGLEKLEKAALETTRHL